MNLKFTARKIAEIEEELNLSFMEIVQKISIKQCAFFIAKGLDITIDLAFFELDKFIAEQGFISVQTAIFSALKEQGFLKVDEEIVKKNIEEKK